MINGVSVNTNIVEIDFSTGYKRISENRDLICRAGIVYTLTQLKDINYVSFSISGEPMLDTDGTAIGALGRDSFMEVLKPNDNKIPASIPTTPHP